MISKQAPTGKETTMLLTNLVVRLLILIATLLLFCLLIVVIGSILLICVIVGILILALASILFGCLLLVFKATCALMAKTITSSVHYQIVIKPWLIVSVKRFVRWFIPRLLWLLWQWASTTRSTSSGPRTGRPFQALAR